MAAMTDEEFEKLGTPQSPSGAPSSSPKYMGDEEFSGLGSAPQEGQHPGMAGSVAAGLRGVREYIPGARDIGAWGTEAVKEGTLFPSWEGQAEEKKRQAAMDAALAKEHPYAYTAGEIAGGVGSMLAPEAAGFGLLGKGAAAEQKVADVLSRGLGSAAEGKLVAGLGSGAISGAAQGAIHGLGTGTSMEERLGHAEKEAAEGVAGGVLGAGLGHGLARVGRKAGELTGLVEKLPSLPKAKEAFEKGSEAYRQAGAQNLIIGRPALQDFAKNITEKLKSEGLHPSLHRELMPAIKELKNIKDPMSLERFEQVRKLTNVPAQNWMNKDQRRLTGIFRESLDEFLDNLKDHQIWSTTGKASDATDYLKEGRKLWKQAGKTQDIEEIFEKAKNRAETTGIGANYNNTVRQEARKLYEKAKKQGKRWTKDEIEALRQLMGGGMVRGAMRQLGRLSPIHGTLSKYAYLGTAPFDPVSTATSAAVGMGAHYLEDYLTKQAEKKALNTVAAGGLSSGVPRINPMESVYGRTVGIPAAMAPIVKPREERANGGKVDGRDYPAKRLTRVEKALKRAQDAIALESKPLMQKPDEQIAQALRIAKGE